MPGLQRVEVPWMMALGSYGQGNTLYSVVGRKKIEWDVTKLVTFNSASEDHQIGSGIAT